MIAVVGGLAVRGALETPEGRIAKETLRERYESSVIEMLHTDREFREKLEINRERRHLIRGGRVMALDGKTQVLGMVERGAKSSAKASISEVRMQPIAERCAADVRVAQRVETLPIGGCLIGLSVDPKEAMARYGEKFYDDKGFRKGLAFLQWYYRIDEHTLLAATYSVDQSDLDIWREVWGKFGGLIPATESTNTWLDHDIQCSGTIVECRSMVQKIRQCFYQERGIPARRQRYSVDEFMAMNQVTSDEMFEELYMNLAVAHETSELGENLGIFVDGLLAGGRHLNASIRTQLSVMRHNRLVGADIALLEQLIRYAVTERLRTALHRLGGDGLALVSQVAAPLGVAPGHYIAASSAGNVLDGARAGRTYGGCTKSINPGKESPEDPLGLNSDRPQDAFGGLDEGEADKKKWQWKRGVCRINYCPTRPRQTEIGPCDVCRSCQNKFDSGLDPVLIYAKRGMLAHKKNSKNLKTFWVGKEKHNEETSVGS
jgi:hypothetical protein